MKEQYFEVLAPAGGPEPLRAAVYAGADAVYLGGPAFGARANAQNFSREQLAEAVGFCHARGVRVHVTVNTLLKEKELPQALEFVEYLCTLPVDAVLVQDMGLFSLLRQRAPQLPLHASTQMSLHTPAGVKLLWDLGAERAVLSREMSLEEIEEVHQACPIQLESFDPFFKKFDDFSMFTLDTDDRFFRVYQSAGFCKTLDDLIRVNCHQLLVNAQQRFTFRSVHQYVFCL